MGERMLRGSRLGAVSYESDRNTELAPRQTREYLCVKGHQFEVPFAVDADHTFCEPRSTPVSLSRSG